MATHCPSLPMATARAPQSPSWPLTEKSEGEGGEGGKKGECTNEYVKERKLMRKKFDLKQVAI